MVVERAMFAFLAKFLLIVRSRLRSQARLQAEILVLRQQLLVLSRKSLLRARLRNLDRLILVWLYRLFPSILDAIAVVKPETVLRWHRRGFRAYWHWKSRRAGGRPKIDREIRALIRRMTHENPVGSAADPRRIADVGDRGRSIDRRQVWIGEGDRPHKAGRPSYATTPPASRPSTYSLCAPSRSSCSTFW